MRYSKEGSSGKGNHEGCLSVRSYFYGLTGSTLRLQREDHEAALCWVHQAKDDSNSGDNLRPQDRLVLLAGQ